MDSFKLCIHFEDILNMCMQLYIYTNFLNNYNGLLIMKRTWSMTGIQTDRQVDAQTDSYRKNNMSLQETGYD